MPLPTVTVGGRKFTILFMDRIRPLSPVERDRLRLDIVAANDGKGRIEVPVVVDEANGIIDGIHRMLIAAELGLKLNQIRFDVRKGLSQKEKEDLCDSLNDARRQQTEDEIAARKQRLADGRKQGKSIRQLAEEEKISHPQVLRDLKSGGGTSEVPPQSEPAAMTQILRDNGRDGAGNLDAADPAQGTSPAQQQKLADLQDATGAEEPEPVPKPRVTGRDGKSYPANKPKPEANGHSPAKPAGPVDALGIPVQEHAAEAWQVQPQVDELLSLLRKASRLYSHICEKPGGFFFTRPGRSVNSSDRWKHKGIEEAIKDAEDCRPAHTVCPGAYHRDAFPQSRHVHNDKCPNCHGLNWTPPLAKESLQPEIVKAMKEDLAGV